MDEVKNFAKIAKEDQKEALQLVQTTQEETEQLNKKVKGFHEQSITILGIFSAVVVGFMACLLYTSDKCLTFSAGDLVEKTHKEDPWQNTKRSEIIAYEAIEKFFKKNDPLELCG